MKKILLFLLVAGMCSAISTYGQELDNGKIPFYAEPYYNYKPLKINVGTYSASLKVNDSAQLGALAEKIRADIDHVNVQTLYVLSLRLYDLGKKDDAFYWFQTAKTRARIFMEMLDPKKIGGMGSEAFELKQLFLSFNQLAGIYLNGYGFNDIDKGIATLEKIKGEVKDIKSYAAVYPKVKFLDDKQLIKVKADKEKEMTEGITYFKANKEEMKKQRIESGVQDKY